MRKKELIKELEKTKKELEEYKRSLSKSIEEERITQNNIINFFKSKNKKIIIQKFSYMITNSEGEVIELPSHPMISANEYLKQEGYEKITLNECYDLWVKDLNN